MSLYFWENDTSDALLTPLDNNAVGRLLDKAVNRDRSNRINLDMSGSRILDVGYRALDSCLNITVLEHSVAISSKGAVLDYQTLDIAERLLSGDVASYEFHIL